MEVDEQNLKDIIEVLKKKPSKKGIERAVELLKTLRGE